MRYRLLQVRKLYQKNKLGLIGKPREDQYVLHLPDFQIAQCYEQASADNDAIFEEDQITLVKNVTSCILARARCASINPITGERQTSSLTTTTYDKWGKPKTTTVSLYNSLQITPEGNLRIIRLPGTTNIQNYFCTAQPNLRESSWLEYSC